MIYLGRYIIPEGIIPWEGIPDIIYQVYIIYLGGIYTSIYLPVGTQRHFNSIGKLE